MSRYQIVPLSGLQRLNAENLQQAQREAVYATLNTCVEVDALEELRKRSECDAACPACPYVMRAVALTLPEFPRLNAQFCNEGLCVYGEVSLGLMVARDDGVLVPAVQGAERLGPEALAREAADLAREAHSGRTHRHKARRPTFTVIDLSDYAVDAFTPILPARSAGILGVGRVERRFLPGNEGLPRAAAVQHVSLTFDHRAADGPYAARFLTAVVRRLEQPEALRASKETVA
jgi:pyruvate dehydrogenase E2 component (dihydrolipoamide acetyltransferase)